MPDEADRRIRAGLRLIKQHMTDEHNAQNVHLHTAIAILVDEFRKVGRLLHEEPLDLCGICGEEYADHRPAAGNSPAFCMSQSSRAGDTFVRGAGR